MHPLRFVSLHSSPCLGDSAGSDAEYILSFRVYRTPINLNSEKRVCLRHTLFFYIRQKFALEHLPYSIHGSYEGVYLGHGVV